MRYIHRLAGLAQTSRELEMTPGIGGRDEGGARRLQVTDFSLQERVCLRRLRQRVDAGTPTAPRRLRQLDQRDARQQTKQRARLPETFCPCARWQESWYVTVSLRRMARPTAHGSQSAPATRVRPSASDPMRARHPCSGIGFKQVAVLTQVRSASSGVRDNRVEAVGGKEIDHPARLVAGQLQLAVVRV